MRLCNASGKCDGSELQNEAIASLEVRGSGFFFITLSALDSLVLKYGVEGVAASGLT